MGLFDAITGSVIMKYKVETDQAKAKIKELSGEQKKAAKEAAEALEKQGKAAESMASQYAKGAAIIVGGFMAARDGLAQMQKETRLATGAAGVDIDALSESWGGLKTRMDLLAFAQAGHQGAWKLTTGQLQLVTEGMRALEKKGFETGAVFDKFTEVIKKGKLEGLDDFGLSLKSTGDQSQDLQVLMRALGKEVLDVGGNFEKTGDAAARSIVKMEDGLTRLRITVGKAADAFVDLGLAIGDGLGRIVGGPLPDDVGPGGRSSTYAQAFQRRGGRVIGGTNAGNLTTGSKLTGYLGGGVTGALGISGSHYNLMAAPSDADIAAGRQLDAFKAQVNRAMSGRGPLATSSPEEFKKLVTGLPEHWREVDADLAAKVDKLGANLQDRFNTVGVEAAQGIFRGFKNALSANRDKVAGGRKRGGGRAKDPGPGLIFGAAHSAYDALSAVADYETAQNDNAAANARNDEIVQQRFAATMEQNRRFAVDYEQLTKDKEDSFLTKVFGPLEEFDKYTFALSTLGDLTKNVWGGIISAIANGEELSGKAIRRAIAQTLAAKATDLGADGVIAILKGMYHTATGDPRGPGEIATGGLMVAGAATLAGLARGIGGTASTPSAPGGAGSGGRAGRNQDHRGANDGSGARTVGQSTVIVLGSDYGDDSRRVRERNAYAAFSRTTTVYQPPRGAAA